MQISHIFRGASSTSSGPAGTFMSLGSLFEVIFASFITLGKWYYIIYFPIFPLHGLYIWPEPAPGCTTCSPFLSSDMYIINSHSNDIMWLLSSEVPLSYYPVIICVTIINSWQWELHILSIVTEIYVMFLDSTTFLKWSKTVPPNCGKFQINWHFKSIYFDIA